MGYIEIGYGGIGSSSCFSESEDGIFGSLGHVSLYEDTKRRKKGEEKAVMNFGPLRVVL